MLDDANFSGISGYVCSHRKTRNPKRVLGLENQEERVVNRVNSRLYTLKRKTPKPWSGAWAQGQGGAAEERAKGKG